MDKNVLPIGLHKLLAVDSYRRTDGCDTYDGYYVVIDGVVYAFEYDHCDGYRSYGDVKVVDIPLEVIKNHFPAQDVFIMLKDKGPEDYNDEQYYSILDAHTAKPVLEIGTDFTDSYYPMAIFHYNPENMAINNK